MHMLREWVERLRGSVRPRRGDHEIEEELRLHLEMAADAERRAGPEREDARRTAARTTGGVAQAMELMRDQRGVPWIDSGRRDLAYAWRAIARNPGFAAIATLTLGAGLALCLAAVAIVNAYLIRQMPYPAADRLYSLVLAPPGGEQPRRLEQIDWQLLDGLVDERIAWDLDMFYLLGGDYPEAARGAWVTPGFVRGLGVRTALGRTLDAGDFAPGPTSVLISDRLWTSRFGRDPNIIGRTFRAYVSDRPDEAEAFTIVGVVDPRFWHFNTFTDVIGPLRAPSYPYMVTLREGVDAATVADRITAMVRGSGQPVPDSWRAGVVPTQAQYAEEMRPLLAAVGVSCLLVLLIACANVAVLLLVRSTRRRHEIAIRMALGATRARLARLLGFEALLLGGGATGLGLALSAILTRGLAPVVEQRLGRRLPGGASALDLDGTLMAAAIAAGLVLTLSLTLVPLLTLWSTTVSPALKAGGRGASDGPAARRLRSVLIAAEIAVALALLAGSGLMIRSSVRLLGVDPGFRTEGVLTSNIGLRPRAYPDADSRVQHFGRLLRVLEDRMPQGSVALSDAWPLQTVRQARVESGGAIAQAGVTRVTTGYFRTLGIDFLDGGTFDRPEGVGMEPIAVVSDSLARRLWPGSRAVGQRLRIREGEDPETAVGTDHLVVGVVRDVRLVDYDDGQVRTNLDRLDAYVPLMRSPGRFVFLYTHGFPDSPESLRLAIAALDREASIGSAVSLAAQYQAARSGPRQLAWLLSGFAAFAAVLALLGVYSIIAYSVRQREREIGVRLVVGADRRTVTGLFIREGATLVAFGLAGGALGAAAIGYVLRSQLFGVAPIEPWLLAGTTMMFGVCAFVALWWPARRASLVDPSQVLKVD